MALRSNPPLKPTRRWTCLLGGCASAHGTGMRWSCTSSAARLDGSVGPLTGALVGVLFAGL